MLSAPQYTAGALRARPHAATKAEVGIGKLSNPGAHNEVGLVVNLALVRLTVSMKDDRQQLLTPSLTRVRPAEPCPPPV
jgi:hypothetical protein